MMNKAHRNSDIRNWEGEASWLILFPSAYKNRQAKVLRTASVNDKAAHPKGERPA
jgi:hypothetical protein